MERYPTMSNENTVPSVENTATVNPNNLLGGIPLTPQLTESMKSSFATKALLECFDDRGNVHTVEIAGKIAQEMYENDPSLFVRIEVIPGKTRTVKGSEMPENRGTLIVSFDRS